MTSTGKEGEEEKQKQIAADAAYEAGIAAIRANDLESAIQFLGSSLENENEIFGEGSIEVAPTYLKYGCVLFWKAQEDNTVFGANAPGGAGGEAGGGDDANTTKNAAATKEEEEKKEERKKKKTTTEKTRTRKEAKTRKTKKKQTWNWRGSC